MILVALLSVALSAEPPDAAGAKVKELFTAGQKLYGQGKFNDAVAKFNEAFAIRAKPAILFNLAKCYEQLDDSPKAMRAYREYLRLSPDAKDKDQVLDSVANLERKLKERGLQQLAIFVEPTVGEIEIDGKYAGKSPVWIELTQGAHRIIARAPGFQMVDRNYTMNLTRSAELTLNLTPVGSEKPADPAPVATTTTTTAKPASDAPVVTTLTPVPTASQPAVTATTDQPRKRTWAWLGLGLTGAAGITSIATLIVSQTSYSTFQTDKTKTPDERVKLYDTANAMGTVSLVTGIVAGTALIATVILFIVEGR